MDKPRRDMAAKTKRPQIWDAGKVHHSEEKALKNVGSKIKENKDKRPFDKKSYRLKKYSNKYQLQRKENQNKMKRLKSYFSVLYDDLVSTSNQNKRVDDYSNGTQGKYVRHPDWVEEQNQLKKQEEAKIEPLSKAREEYRKLKEGDPSLIKQRLKQKVDSLSKVKEQMTKVKEQKLQKQLAIAKAKEEKQKKIEAHKKKRQENFKKLSRKTKKGQPVMSGKLELLFEKIQKNSTS